MLTSYTFLKIYFILQWTQIPRLQHKHAIYRGRIKSALKAMMNKIILVAYYNKNVNNVLF